MNEIAINDTFVLYHNISKNKNDIKDILSINSENIDNIWENIDIQKLEKLEFKPEKIGEYTFDINGNTYTIEVYPPENGVSNWNFEEGNENNVTDIWENGQDGTILNGNWVSDSPHGEYSIDMNSGNNDMIDMGPSDNWDFSSAFTLTCWIKSSKTASPDSTGSGWFVNGGHNKTNGFAFYLDDTDGHRFLTNNEDIISDNSINTDIWLFMAAVYDGNEVTIYEGSLSSSINSVATGEVDADMNGNHTLAIAGSTSDWGGEGWGDPFDDPRIYDTDLSISRLNNIRLGNE